jgi:hypothetical protein
MPSPPSPLPAAPGLALSLALALPAALGGRAAGAAEPAPATISPPAAWHRLSSRERLAEDASGHGRAAVVVGVGWTDRDPGRASAALCGGSAHLELPLTLALSVDFKWADKLPDDFAAGDLYLHGDVAPNGRFNYRYRE